MLVLLEAEDNVDLTVYVFVLEGDEDINDWDARKYPHCKPYLGKKGVQWETFVRNFGSAMAAIADDDSDLEETMLGTDIGGDVWLQNNPGGANAAQTRRRTKRLKQLHAHIYRHVADLRLREMVSPVGNVRDGRAAYRMLEQHCTRTITDLEIETLNAEWDQSSITASVGVTLDSITMFARHLNGLNARRPALINGQPGRKSEDELTKKLLLSLTPKLSAVLHHEAAKEMRAAPADRAFWNAAANPPHRDFAEAVRALDELWRVQFEAGGIAPAPRQGGNPRVDAAVFGDDDEVYFQGGTPRRDTGGTSRVALTVAELRAEPMCWRCRGFGHLRENCPSSDKLRPIQSCVEVLSGIARSAPAVRGGAGRGRGRGSGMRGRLRPQPGRRPGALVVSDGHIYDATGELLGVFDDAEHEPEPGPTEHEPEPEAEPAPDDDALPYVDCESGDEWQFYAASTDTSRSSSPMLGLVSAEPIHRSGRPVTPAIQHYVDLPWYKHGACLERSRAIVQHARGVAPCTCYSVDGVAYVCRSVSSPMTATALRMNSQRRALTRSPTCRSSLSWMLREKPTCLLSQMTSVTCRTALPSTLSTTRVTSATCRASAAWMTFVSTLTSSAQRPPPCP